MKRSTIVILVLSAALVLTNGWWIYQMLDAGVTATYRDVAFRDNERALEQTLAVIPIAMQSQATRDEVVAAALAAAEHKDTFEKDGYLWIDRIGLRFGENGKLTAVAKAWQ